MTSELVRTGAAGLEEPDEAAALALLLTLTTDAVLVFDADGTVLLANEEAERLFRAHSDTLVGTNVRLIFPPAETVDKMRGTLEDALPFRMDGSTTTLVCEGSDNNPYRIRVRCERISQGRGAYLLCGHIALGSDGVQSENDRLMEELSRANRRLSGTLGIVLGTLDSLDVGTLFSRILDEITQTMDAWASLVYVAEQDGYRLRGTTDSLDGIVVPTFFSYDYPLAELVSRQGHTICMRVQPLTREELRGGHVGSRTIVDEESGARMSIPSEFLPPCPSFAVVPVWFGGHMIALIMVGWKHAHRLRRDDARLLDAVAEYLSVQLAGAFAALRAQHAESLDSLGSTLRERLLAGSDVDAALVRSLFEEAARGLDASCVALEGNSFQRTTMGDFPVLGRHSVPVDLALLCRTTQLPAVLDTRKLEGLSQWLDEHGERSLGLCVCLGSLDEAERGFLILRDKNAEPFDEVDIAFLSRLASDVLEVLAGEQERKRDKRISQALQLGMRNELQKVEGISAQSCYSSATKAAFVGGDFYDLVRLPQRRACVIMGDVSGKGVEAASVSSAVKTALGAYAWEGLTPAHMVKLLNEFLLGFSRIETFATLFVGVVDLAEKTLTYCSAGHPPALMVRADSGELSMLDVQSGVVGAFEGLLYRDGAVRLHKNDVLLLYTDGVTEARSTDGAFFGEDGLRDVVLREVPKGFEGLCDRVLDGVSSFAGNSLEDDVALVVLRFDEVG